MSGERRATRYLKWAPWHAPAVTAAVRVRVSEMLSEIERGGERAIRRYSAALDGWSPADFVVEQAATGAPRELAGHIAFALEQVRTFAAAQRASLGSLELETLPGVTVGHRHIPVGSVGAHVPAGGRPMVTSALMTVVVAKVAGVAHVTAAVPPRRGGGVDPALLHALAVAGVDRVLCLGGVQAMAAMAFGLCGTEPCDMLVGAGDVYVAEAKRQLYGTVGVDVPAGPTEIAVIADETADAVRVATDLLAQVEHGPTSPALLISTSEALARAVLAAVDELLTEWPARATAERAWRDHGSVAVVEDDEAAMRLADRYAPEHVEVHVAASKLDAYLHGLRNYGALFLGPEATVAYGAAATGTNDVLPALGAARFTGGLWVGTFLKTCTYQRVTPPGTRALAPAAAALSRAGGAAGHARAAELRLLQAR